MSRFDVFQADEKAVQEALASIRERFPTADIAVTVEDGIIVVSGRTASDEERNAIICALRAVNPGVTPVIFGGLEVAEDTSDSGTGRRRVTGLDLPCRMEELARRTTQRIYRVQQGDTLETVAVRFYSDPKAVRLLCLVNGNQLASPREVQPGTMLNVPETLYHSVAPGETLDAVATRYYHDASLTSELRKANPEVGTREDLQPGSTVRVPINL